MKTLILVKTERRVRVSFSFGEIATMYDDQDESEDKVKVKLVRGESSSRSTTQRSQKWLQVSERVYLYLQGPLKLNCDLLLGILSE